MTQDERFPRLQPEKPKKRRSRRLLMLLLLFFITLLAVLFFKSSISRIEEIHIQGNRYLTQDQIGQASGVITGDQFLFTWPATVAGRVAELPLVKKVRVTKSFPGKITITVTEYPEVAMELTDSGQYAVVLENAMAVKPKEDFVMPDKPVLSGWPAKGKVREELCELLAQIPAEKLTDISEIKPDPSASYPEKIKLFTRTHFEVTTTVSYLQSKLDVMATIISDEEPGKITLLEADTYVPFADEQTSNTESSTDEE